MAALHGPRAAQFLTIMVLIATFGCLFTSLLTFSRVLYAGAVDGQFFPIFARLHPRRRFPSTSSRGCWRNVERPLRAPVRDASEGGYRFSNSDAVSSTDRCCFSHPAQPPGYRPSVPNVDVSCSSLGCLGRLAICIAVKRARNYLDCRCNRRLGYRDISFPRQ
jgi:hypothetical protein